MMKKRLLAVFFALLLFIISAVPVLAAGDLPRLVDDADLLSDSEEAALQNKLDEISERQRVDIVVVTVNSLEGESAMEYADDFFDYYGYGFGDARDGILLLLSMEERDWYISTSGYGITAVTDAGRSYMSEVFVGDLSAGNYAAAFTIFAELCDDFISQADTGMPYDVDNLPQEPFGAFSNLLIALGIGFVISLIATGIMKGKLKTVHSQSAADSYTREGSMQLTKESDLFLYKHVERSEKPKENTSSTSNTSGGSSTHTSSSGSTHGGGGGKF